MLYWDVHNRGQVFWLSYCPCHVWLLFIRCCCHSHPGLHTINRCPKFNCLDGRPSPLWRGGVACNRSAAGCRHNLAAILPLFVPVVFWLWDFGMVFFFVKTLNSYGLDIKLRESWKGSRGHIVSVGRSVCPTGSSFFLVDSWRETWTNSVVKPSTPNIWNIWRLKGKNRS